MLRKVIMYCQRQDSKSAVKEEDNQKTEYSYGSELDRRADLRERAISYGKCVNLHVRQTHNSPCHLDTVCTVLLYD